MNPDRVNWAAVWDRSQARQSDIVMRADPLDVTEDELLAAWHRELATPRMVVVPPVESGPPIVGLLILLVVFAVGLGVGVVVGIGL